MRKEPDGSVVTASVSEDVHVSVSVDMQGQCECVMLDVHHGQSTVWGTPGSGV